MTTPHLFKGYVWGRYFHTGFCLREPCRELKQSRLKAFLFAVHPDFFDSTPGKGKRLFIYLLMFSVCIFRKKFIDVSLFYFVCNALDIFFQEVNENSLKRLSAYLENLQKPGFKSLKPTQLMFYVRERDQNSSDGQEHFSTSGFRAVRFTLHTRDLLSTVLYILNSCSLSTEHVQSLNNNVHSQPLKEAKGMSDRPIKWDKSYYSFTGFKDPDEDLEQVWRTETTLTYIITSKTFTMTIKRNLYKVCLAHISEMDMSPSAVLLVNGQPPRQSWLDNNGESAVKKLKNSLPLRKELDRLKDELSHQLQLSDISAKRMKPVWTVTRGSVALSSGCTVIFTDRSGVSAVGHVMLGTMDVHHHWTKLFERLPSYFDLQRRLMLLEDQISYLLGGIQVVYIEELQPVLTLEEYYSLLDVFYNRLLKSRVPFHPRSLHGLQMILNSDRYAPSLHELGHFNIPILCDPANLQWFILTKAQQAREKMKRKEE
ncbi:T-cell activation inhibitor; mitochondrial [Camelus dromedarius]|uniref:T-cell activation inhibitor n=1 Tax=Camelus dromedarius TaxID=9838 RepID=A0A5N4CZ34_CAMDR|nr:T-cell activation inhibitor; mitochondrial [Camelus dromedarius]